MMSVNKCVLNWVKKKEKMYGHLNKCAVKRAKMHDHLKTSQQGQQEGKTRNEEIMFW